jgi:subtilase family serine protease
VLADPLTYAPCGYKPPQLRGAYGIDNSLKAGYDGRGATVAVVDAYASATILADAQTYARRNDSQHPLRSYQFGQLLPATYTDTHSCGASGWYGEETLDVEAVHAMAPAANILYVGASSCYDTDLNAAVNTVVDNSLAQVITNSYGDVGEQIPASDVAEAHQTFIQAAAQGISVLFSSGDSGDEIANTGSRQVDWSASDPFVTAVGGTSLAVGRNTDYLFEQGWGTGRSNLVKGLWDPATPSYLYGGGGTSQLFKQPNYQKKVVPNSISNYFGQGAHRAVPDVGMVGDPNTGFLVGQSQNFPGGSIHYSEYRIGGTSLPSPLFAGVVAVADQVNGDSLGFLNPKIYKLAGSSAFRDVKHIQGVTDGVVRVDFVNGYDATGGLRTSLRTLNQTGTIFTRTGYDDVTGVGSPNGLSFLLSMARGR